MVDKGDIDNFPLEFYRKYAKAKTHSGGVIMKYVCDLCGWEYDEEDGCPESGIAPNTSWEDLPEDFECPICCVGKDQFSEVRE